MREWFSFLAAQFVALLAIGIVWPIFFEQVAVGTRGVVHPMMQALLVTGLPAALLSSELWPLGGGTELYARTIRPLLRPIALERSSVSVESSDQIVCASVAAHHVIRLLGGLDVSSAFRLVNGGHPQARSSFHSALGTSSATPLAKDSTPPPFPNPFFPLQAFLDGTSRSFGQHTARRGAGLISIAREKSETACLSSPVLEYASPRIEYAKALRGLTSIALVASEIASGILRSRFSNIARWHKAKSFLGSNAIALLTSRVSANSSSPLSRSARWQ